MKYYEILDFQDEPFSNSPDPDFFYESPKHLECLQRLEIAIRLRRGLNVVMGDVGAGKTTLCRRLLRELSEDERVQAHLLLDPDFDNPRDFLRVLVTLLAGEEPEAGLSEWALKEAVKSALFDKGATDERVTALIIDEGQKINPRCLELLRELLNYETNSFKLLQIVIFAQLEFKALIDDHPNVADRINEVIVLESLNFRHTRELVRHRINLARVHYDKNPVFTLGAHYALYRATGGHPRKVVRLAHKVFVAMILQDRTRADWALVRDVCRNNKHAARREDYAPTARATAPSLDREARSREASRRPVTGNHAGDPLHDVDRAEPRSPLFYGFTAVAASLLLLLAVDVRAPRYATDHTAVSEVRMAVQRPVAIGEDAAGISPAAGQAAMAGAAHDPQTTGDGAVLEAAPAVLGALTLQERTSMATLIERIYGHFNEDLLHLVATANEGLEGETAAPAGAEVVFPVARQLPPAALEEGARVRFATTSELGEAYALLCELAGGADSNQRGAPAILPEWRPGAPVAFHLVLSEPFQEESRALRALRRFPALKGHTAAIVAVWRDDALLLADVEAWRSPMRGAVSSAAACVTEPTATP